MTGLPGRVAIISIFWASRMLMVVYWKLSVFGRTTSTGVGGQVRIPYRPPSRATAGSATPVALARPRRGRVHRGGAPPPGGPRPYGATSSFASAREVGSGLPGCFQASTLIQRSRSAGETGSGDTASSTRMPPGGSFEASTRRLSAPQPWPWARPQPRLRVEALSLQHGLPVAWQRPRRA